jgi:tetratricopeptide (TPR) repeat protein
MRPDRPVDAQIFFLPLAVPPNEAPDAVDFEILGRRIPDFMHQWINQGDGGPTGIVEIQSPPEDGEIRWVVLEEPPDPAAAFALLPEGEAARAIVTGSILPHDGTFDVELGVFFADERDLVSRLHATVSVEDPVPGLCRLGERLARLLGVTLPAPPSGLLTRSGPAFFKYLQGLDGAALLSGEVAAGAARDAETLLAPFAEALRLDPTFGLALRTVNVTLAQALDQRRVPLPACCRLIDRCLQTGPGDGDGCVAVAEHLAGIGERQRAFAWLQHAANLDPPPARGLENLGIVFANRGDTVAARDLWLQGLAVDGHPDFFAHLARLAFTQRDETEAWDNVLRGLHRILERATRAEEWDDDGRGSGVMLPYLVEHLSEHAAPIEVVAALKGLVGSLANCEDRVHLGVSLVAVGELACAREELQAGLAGDVAPGVRDQGVRAELALVVPDFEERFRAAAEQTTRPCDPRAALAELESFRALSPAFWPAAYYGGLALNRLGREEEALDLFADVVRRCPGQPDALLEMAALFDRRGNPKRALECIDDALRARSSDGKLLGRRALYLFRLGRREEAREALARAEAVLPDDRDLREIRRMVG